MDLLDGLASHYGDDWWFNSQHAFAMVETGQRDAARRKIESAMAQYPDNAHGVHIRAHVYYEDGEQDAARRYLKDWLPAYPREALLHCHISWHLALCELEAGNAAEAFRICTESISPDATCGPPLNAMTDTISFLWRAELAGQPRDPDRWRVVHDFTRKMFPHAALAFVDTHATLAHAVASDAAAFEARLLEMANMAQAGRLPSGSVVPALSRGFAAYLRQDFSAAINAIEPVFNEHERIGGSRAQRDLVEFTLLKAYMNAGRPDDVHRLLRQRHSRPASIPIAGLPV